MDFKFDPKLAAQAGLEARGGADLGQVKLENHWVIECFDKEGKLKWREEFDNLVTTAGKNDLLTQYLKGSTYTAAWYVGLTGATPTFDAADTMSSHAGWTENSADYSQANRPALTLGSASSGSIDNSASKAAFSITGTATIGGAFVVNNSTKGGTSGTLYGGAAFTEGNRSVVNGDTLNVQVTLTAS